MIRGLVSRNSERAITLTGRRPPGLAPAAAGPSASAAPEGGRAPVTCVTRRPFAAVVLGVSSAGGALAVVDDWSAAGASEPGVGAAGSSASCDTLPDAV